ncbi:MAG: 3'(2'),5'-bisphosphate nucleotidase [Planctomycetota bacterium]
MVNTPEAQFAVDAVREAGQLVRRVQAEMVTDALVKGDKSPVTVGDFAAQAVVAKRLADALPGAVLIGEENAAELRAASGAETLAQVTRFVQSVFPDATPEAVCDWIDQGAENGGAENGDAGEPPGAFWTLDPIDGTKGFLRGDQYAVALAYLRGGAVEIGVLCCPELAGGVTPAKGDDGSVVLAVRGGGAQVQAMDGEPNDWTQLSVSAVSDASQTRMLRSVEKGHTNMDAIGQVAQAMGVTADPVGMDSQAKYAVLAAGGGEMLLRLLSPDRPDYREKIWDQAAGSIVIEEAGGRVTDLDGKPLDFSHGRTLANNRGVLATNGHLHQAALAGLRAIGA